MSKHFRPWKIDETHLLPPSVQDYVAEDHLSRLIVSVVSQSERGVLAARMGSEKITPALLGFALRRDSPVEVFI